MRYPEACLQIFTRAPVAGSVKTRLIPKLGADGAAQLQSQLTHDVLAMSTATNLCHVHHRFFAACQSRFSVPLQPQAAGDIGEKMKHAAASALARYGHVVIIGTDCPALCSTDIDLALQTLQQGIDVCLKPAEDGGYVLIALRRRLDAVFDAMPWGTSQVMQATRQRLNTLSVSYRELQTTWDLDRPEDLIRYERFSGKIAHRQCG